MTPEGAGGKEAAMRPTVPLATRVLVYGFLAVLVVAAMFRLEWWPVTSWRLFSGVRGNIVYGWEVRSVDADGSEHLVRFSQLPRAYSGWYQLAQQFPHMEADGRADVCASWLHAVQTAGEDAVGVRVYFLHHATRTDFDRPPPEVVRRVYYACGST
jgi:hypothetical protein